MYKIKSVTSYHVNQSDMLIGTSTYVSTCLIGWRCCATPLTRIVPQNVLMSRHSEFSIKNKKSFWEWLIEFLKLWSHSIASYCAVRNLQAQRFRIWAEVGCIRAFAEFGLLVNSGQSVWPLKTFGHEPLICLNKVLINLSEDDLECQLLC
jgi:hypothetical protein